MDPQVPTTMMGTVGNSHKQTSKNKRFGLTGRRQLITTTWNG